MRWKGVDLRPVILPTSPQNQNQLSLCRADVSQMQSSSFTASEFRIKLLSSPPTVREILECWSDCVRVPPVVLVRIVEIGGVQMIGENLESNHDFALKPIS
jgi:hypothetical protein